jgi:hypothetical protein
MWMRVALLVAGAAVPVAGVLSGSWSLREVVVLYWAENVIIGLLQVVKMLAASPRDMPPAGHLAKLFLVPFFTFHYGMFCFVHGVFVFAITGGAFGGKGGGGPVGGPLEMFGSMADFPKPFWLALGLIGANHVQQAVQRFFLSGAWRAGGGKGLQDLMGEPYKHIVVVHLGILFGAFLAVALGNAIGVLLIIVAGKFLIDLREVKRDLAEGTKAPGAGADGDAGAVAAAGRGRRGWKRPDSPR